MANTINGNSIYVDSTGALSNTDGLLVMAIILTPTAGNAIIKLEDTTSTNVLIDYRASSANDSAYLDLTSSPLVFPGGLTIDTITNGVATLITRRRGTGGN